MGGIGLLPLAPGTWCSVVVAIPALLFPLEQEMVRLSYAVACIVLIVASWWSVPRVQGRWGTDPGRVVIDEALGMSIIFIFPYGYLAWWWWLGSVLLFRLFDIRKPWPLNVINARSEWWAVMLDDVGAALITALVLHLSLIGSTILVVILLGSAH